MSKLLVGLYQIGHDSNISFLNTDTGELKYIKYERLNNIKHYAANNYIEWRIYLEHYGYTLKDVKSVCKVKSPTEDMFSNYKVEDYPSHIKHYEIPHHLGHLLSSILTSGLVYDGEGTEGESFSVYKEKRKHISFTNNSHWSLGLVYNQAFCDMGLHKEDPIFQSLQRSNPMMTDLAGKVMAWEAYGEYLSKWQEEYKNNSLKDIQQWASIVDFFKNSSKWTDQKDEFKLQGSFIKNITHKATKEIIDILNIVFDKKDKFTFTGGVAQNLILNNQIKQNFKNFTVLPHSSDDGLSLGGLKFLCDEEKFNIDLLTNKYPFIQADENMGFASSKTIKKAAELLATGNIVLWAQGNGEIGPRALGHRSILMNPGIFDAKEQVNKKVKHREWYRPYAASVKVDTYKEYFDLDWESPFMLYQANVKDKKTFNSITHADGTCRIQTVYNGQQTYYELLDEFEKLTGYPILLNTSLNKPGYPIVGTKERAIDMFKNSEADYLVIGDTLLKNE